MLASSHFLLFGRQGRKKRMEQYNRIVEIWQSHKIISFADLDRHLESFRILFAYHSGKIENDEITYNNTREIFDTGRVNNFSGDPRALFEQQNQKLCFELIKSRAISKESISIELIKEVHAALAGGTYGEHMYIENGERPGEFKKHDYVTGVNQVGSASKNIKSDLSDLVEEINEYDGKDVLKAATYFHARFEFIHPFSDGNGRVGRTIINFYLMTHNHPPFIVYDEDKQMYYECLQKYDDDELLEPLYEFFKYEIEKTWKDTFETIITMD